MTTEAAALFGDLPVNPALDEGVQGAARFCLLARAEVERAEAALKKAKELLDGAERNVIDVMQQAGLSAVKLDCPGGRVTVSLAESVYFSAPAGSLEDTGFFQWLLRSGGHDLVKRTVHHASFSSFCRELREQERSIHPAVRMIEKKQVRVKKE